MGDGEGEGKPTKRATHTHYSHYSHTTHTQGGWLCTHTCPEIHFVATAGRAAAVLTGAVVVSHEWQTQAVADLPKSMRYVI